jgi:hypothetical protein
MSTSEDLFLSTGLNLQEAARRIAKTLGMQMRKIEDGNILLGDENFSNLPGVTRAELSTNIFSSNGADPEDIAVYDGTDVVLHIWRPDKDLDLQHQAGREAMKRLVEAYRWPAVLLHDMDVLVATWSLKHGCQIYPPGTGPGIEDLSVWKAARDL